MQADKRKAVLAAIHIKKSAMHLSDELYRSIMSDNFGKDSSKDLSDDQLHTFLQILDYMQTGKPIQRPELINRKQLSYLHDLLGLAGISFPVQYVSKIVHHEVFALEQLTKSEAGACIHALQAMSRRKKR